MHQCKETQEEENEKEIEKKTRHQRSSLQIARHIKTTRHKC